MHTTVVTQTTRPLVLAALLALGLGTSSVLASPKIPTSAAEKKESVMLPKTPEEYLATADEYKKKAAAYRAEAAAHRKMLEQYKEGFPAVEGQLDEDSYVKKMRLHCEGFINKAEALATETEKFGDFYRERAAELRTPAVKLPVTPKEHLAKAEEYKKKAAAYRTEAAAHRKTLEEYIQNFPRDERVDEDPYLKKVRILREGYINKTEALATEAENFADFHRARAAELRGK
jgi:hypothetical protein